MGPLAGVRIIEAGGIGPVPFCGMLLSDLGADVVRLDRPASAREGGPAGTERVLRRGRRSIAIDLKSAEGTELARALIGSADGLIEGFRPGVMERLGLGPDVCLGDNPRLVYGRMTGWGQDGPNAQAPGHDINYLALAGALAPIGRRGAAPVPPLNLVADFGGGAMLLAVGILAALVEARSSGAGQVIDAAMVDGAGLLMTMMYEMLSAGHWTEELGSNINDSGAPFYEVYRTSDDEFICVGAMEAQFYEPLMRHLGLAPEDFPDPSDSARWPELKGRLADIFGQRTRAEWCELLDRADVCFTPVLRMSEAPAHPHNVARHAFVTVGDDLVPAPAPRFSRTTLSHPTVADRPGEGTDDILAELGLTTQSVSDLRARGVVQ